MTSAQVNCVFARLTIFLLTIQSIGSPLVSSFNPFEEAGDALKSFGNDAADFGNGIIDDFDTFFDGFDPDSVGNAFTSLGNSLINLAKLTGAFLYQQGEGLAMGVLSIAQIPELNIDIIGEIETGFENTWDTISDGAKFLVKGLKSIDIDFEDLIDSLLNAFEVGLDFLKEFFDLDWAPYPFNVLKGKDFVTVVECVDDLVLEAGKEFASSIATAVVEMGSPYAIDPVFNDEGIKEELNKTQECFADLSNDLKERDGEDTKSLSDAILDAMKWFAFDELVIGVELGLELCLVVCGTASFGIAVAPESFQAGLYYTLGWGVELSPSIGGDISIALNFWPSFGAVSGEAFVLSFSTGIPLIGDLPALVMSKNNDTGEYDFAGFSISDSLLSDPCGCTDAFNIGASVVNAWWIVTLDDLIADKWSAKNFSVAGGTEETDPTEAIESLSESMVGGGFRYSVNYLANSDYGTQYQCGSGTTTFFNGGYNQIDFIRYPGISNIINDDTGEQLDYYYDIICPTDQLTIKCPSTNLTGQNPGNMSLIKVGYLMIHEVIHGLNELNSDRFCNTSTAFEFIWSKCSMETDCEINPLDDMYQHEEYLDENGNVFGCPKCDNISAVVSIDHYYEDGGGSSFISDAASFFGGGQSQSTLTPDITRECSISLDVMYSCPSAEVSSIFNAGCYSTMIFNLLQDSDGGIVDGRKDHWWLKDDPDYRTNPIAKCARSAAELGYEAFGMHDGLCYTTDNFVDVFDSYNQTECPPDGTGNWQTLNVWVFANDQLVYEDRGCRNRSYLVNHGAQIADMEGNHVLTQDDYESRGNAVSKCAQIADEYGVNSFAVLDNGACHVMCVNDDLADQNATHDCGGGRGDATNYNLYTFSTGKNTTAYCEMPESLEAFLITGTDGGGDDDEELSVGAIVGIAIGCFVFVLCVAGAFVGWWYYKKQQDTGSVAVKRLGVEVKGVEAGNNGWKIPQTTAATTESVQKPLAQKTAPAMTSEQQKSVEIVGASAAQHTHTHTHTSSQDKVNTSEGTQFVQPVKSVENVPQRAQQQPMQRFAPGGGPGMRGSSGGAPAFMNGPGGAAPGAGPKPAFMGGGGMPRGKY